MHGLKVASFFIYFHVELGVQRKIFVFFMLVLVAKDTPEGGGGIESCIGNIYLLNYRSQSGVRVALGKLCVYFERLVAQVIRPLLPGIYCTCHYWLQLQNWLRHSRKRNVASIPVAPAR
jgi:hypothetical protein